MARVLVPVAGIHEKVIKPLPNETAFVPSNSIIESPGCPLTKNNFYFDGGDDRMQTHSLFSFLPTYDVQNKDKPCLPVPEDGQGPPLVCEIPA